MILEDHSCVNASQIDPVRVARMQERMRMIKYLEDRLIELPDSHRVTRMVAEVFLELNWKEFEAMATQATTELGQLGPGALVLSTE